MPGENLIGSQNPILTMDLENVQMNKKKEKGEFNLQDVKLVQTRCQNVSKSKFCQKLIAVVDGPAIGQPW
jgi:hypothetical protein